MFWSPAITNNPVLLSTFCLVELALFSFVSSEFLIMGAPSPGGKLMLLMLEVL